MAHDHEQHAERTRFTLPLFHPYEPGQLPVTITFIDDGWVVRQGSDILEVRDWRTGRDPAISTAATVATELMRAGAELVTRLEPAERPDTNRTQRSDGACERR